MRSVFSLNETWCIFAFKLIASISAIIYAYDFTFEAYVVPNNNATANESFISFYYLIINNKLIFNELKLF